MCEEKEKDNRDEYFFVWKVDKEWNITGVHVHRHSKDKGPKDWYLDYVKGNFKLEEGEV